MAFRQYFLRPPELTKIVLPKVLQTFKFHLLAKGTEPCFFGNGRFFREKKSPKGPPFNCFGYCDRLGIEKSRRVPLSIFFGVVRLFSKFFFSAVEENTLKLWCPFAIFEPWIWRRLGPVPACSSFAFNRNVQ